MDQRIHSDNLAAWAEAYGPPPAWTSAAVSGRAEPCSTPSPGAIAWVRAHIPEGAPAVILLGAGAGDELVALPIVRPSTQVVVVEPDPAVAAEIMARCDLSAAVRAGRLALLAGPDYAGAARIVRVHRSVGAAAIVTHPDLAARPDALAEARGAAERLAFEASANDQARQASSARYVLHSLANATRIAREGNVSALAGLAPGVPAVIAAAGPSLNRNLHDVGPVLDRAVIIACDTAALPLLSSAVEPDFIVAADPTRANAGHLSALPPSRAWLVAEGSLHPSAFTHFADRTFVFRVAGHEPWPWLHAMGFDRGTLETWGSVATSALSLAISLGCDPIIFVGADFAFTEGRPYCRGTSLEPRWAAWRAGGVDDAAIWASAIGAWSDVRATDIHGAEVRTARHLVSFRDFVVDRCASAPGSRVINATGAGLLHGPRIEQATAAATLWYAPVVDRAEIHRAAKAAHLRSRGHVGPVLAAMTRVLCGMDDGTVERWLRFAAPTLARPAIEAALRTPEYEAFALALSVTQLAEGQSA